MGLSFYMDVHIPRAITTGLRLRNINVLTSQEDNTMLLDDYSLLRRASSLGRILVSFDEDFLSMPVKCKRREKISTRLFIVIF